MAQTSTEASRDEAARRAASAESAPSRRGAALLVFSILLAILAVCAAFEAGYLVANGNAVADALAQQDLASSDGLDEIQTYFNPHSTSIVQDYRDYGVALVVVSLTNAVVEAIACWQGIVSYRRQRESAVCETLGIGLMGLAAIELSLNTLAVGPEPGVFAIALVAAGIALGYFLSARRLATTDFWKGIKEDEDTEAEQAAWVAEVEARAAALPRVWHLGPGLMLEPVRGEGTAGAEPDRTADLHALFSAPPVASGEEPAFCSMAVVAEDEFALIAPIAAHLADDGDRDPEEVPVGHCRAYAFQTCVAGTLGFPPSALEPLLPGAWRDVEAHFYLDAERLVFGTDDPEFVVLVNDYVKDQSYRKTSGGTALFEILEFLVDDGLMFLADEETRLELLEDNMGEDVTEIPHDFDLFITHERRTLGELYNFYRQYGDMAKALATSRSAVLDAEERSLFGVLADSSRHMAADTQELREFSLQLRALYQSKIDVRQNKVMSLLTVVTTIFMPLTLITGWFGMNFDVMPELHWEGSYYVVIAISFAVVTAEVIFFKHKKWF